MGSSIPALIAILLAPLVQQLPMVLLSALIFAVLRKREESLSSLKIWSASFQIYVLAAVIHLSVWLIWYARNFSTKDGFLVRPSFLVTNPIVYLFLGSSVYFAVLGSQGKLSRPALFKSWIYFLSAGLLLLLLTRLSGLSF